MARNPWIDFLSAFRKSHPKLSMSSAMKQAAVKYRAQKGKGDAPKKKGQKGKGR